MASKKASEIVAGDKFFHHDQDIEDNCTRTTLTCVQDAELRPDGFGIDRAVIICEISDPVVVRGERITDRAGQALEKGAGAMIFGPDLDLEIADA